MFVKYLISTVTIHDHLLSTLLNRYQPSIYSPLLTTNLFTFPIIFWSFALLWSHGRTLGYPTMAMLLGNSDGSTDLIFPKLVLFTAPNSTMPQILGTNASWFSLVIVMLFYWQSMNLPSQTYDYHTGPSGFGQLVLSWHTRGTRVSLPHELSSKASKWLCWNISMMAVAWPVTIIYGLFTWINPYPWTSRKNTFSFEYLWVVSYI